MFLNKGINKKVTKSSKFDFLLSSYLAYSTLSIPEGQQEMNLP